VEDTILCEDHDSGNPVSMSLV